MSPQNTRRVKVFLFLLLSHIVAAFVSFWICFGVPMLIYDYQTRNESAENLRYDGIGMWMFFLYTIAITLFFSLPATLILQWFQDRRRSKRWKIVFAIVVVPLLIYWFAVIGSPPEPLALVYALANFSIYWLIFTKLKHRFLQHPSLNNSTE